MSTSRINGEDSRPLLIDATLIGLSNTGMLVKWEESKGEPQNNEEVPPHNPIVYCVVPSEAPLRRELVEWASVAFHPWGRGSLGPGGHCDPLDMYILYIFVNIPLGNSDQIVRRGRCVHSTRQISRHRVYHAGGQASISRSIYIPIGGTKHK